MSCNEWQKVKLGDLIESISVKHSFNKNKLIFLNTSDILEGKVLHNNYSDIEGLPGQAKKSIKKDDILFSEIRPKNKRFAYVDFDSDDYVVSTKLMVLRKKPNNINNRYLYYYLTSDKTLNYLQTIAEGRSGTFPQITFNELKIIEIDLPPLEEQEKIANILSSLDDKIELNNEMNKTLEEMAQSLFKRWFVDFEFPNEDGEPYKSSGGEMVDSELGMIPNGWEVKALGDICDVKGGKRLPKGKAVLDEKTEYPYLRVTDITSGYVNMNSIKYIDEETREKISRYIIEYSDLYISIAGTIGLVGSINKELDGASLTENMARIICNNIEKYYMRLYLNYGEIQHLIKTRAVGSTQPKLPLYVIKDIPVLVPTDKVMNRFKEIIIPVYKSIEENLSNIETIVEIRDSLLPKLMSGEIKV